MSVPMPECVQVGPLEFTVTQAASDVIDMIRENPRLAQTDLVNLKMTIDGGRPLGGLRNSLLHETLHAIFYVAGGWCDEWTEEDAISRVSHLLLDVLRRNPEMVAYLCAPETA